MDLFYDIHPPSEVHVPESMYPIETRSRSPSPLSLRDPQDDGDYHQDGSSDEEGKAARPVASQRPSRPVPLSLAVASLDLPSLSHPRRHRSPDLARRSLRRVGTTDSAQNNANVGDEGSSNAMVATTPVRSEAPFDEAINSPSQILSEETPLPSTLISASANPIHETTLEGSFSHHISRLATTDVLAYDMDEPPACELQEPPSLTSFHRGPFSSVVPCVTSPRPPIRSRHRGIHSATEIARPFVESTKSLPFEDECDEDPTLREETEEKKTSDPGLGGSSRDVSVGQLTSIYEQYMQKGSSNHLLAASVTKQTLNSPQNLAHSPPTHHLLAPSTSRTRQHLSDNTSMSSYPTRQAAADPPATYWHERVPSGRALGKSDAVEDTHGRSSSAVDKQWRSQANDAPGISFPPVEFKNDHSDAGSVISLPSLRKDSRVQGLSARVDEKPPQQKRCASVDRSPIKQQNADVSLPLYESAARKPSMGPMHKQHRNALAMDEGALQPGVRPPIHQPTAKISLLPPDGVAEHTPLASYSATTSRVPTGPQPEALSSGDRQHERESIPLSNESVLSQPPPKTPRRCPVPKPESAGKETSPQSPPFSPAPLARSWMEEEKVTRRLAPSRQDTPSIRQQNMSHDPVLSSDFTVVARSVTEQASKISPPTMLHINEQRQARDRIKNRIRCQSFDNHDKNVLRTNDDVIQSSQSFDHPEYQSSQSFDHPESTLYNPIEMKRSVSLDIHRAASVDLERSISSLPETPGEEKEVFSLPKTRTQGESGTNPNETLQNEALRRRKRLEMSQAEYMTMRAKQSSPEKQSPDMSVNEAYLFPVRGKSSSPSSNVEGPDRQTETRKIPTLPLPDRAAVDPSLKTESTVECDSASYFIDSEMQPRPFQKAVSLDGRQFHLYDAEDEHALLPSRPLVKTSSLDGPQFLTPRTSHGQAVLSVPQSNQSVVTMDPPSLKRTRAASDSYIVDHFGGPLTPRPESNQPHSASPPRCQEKELTPRRSNAATPEFNGSLRPKPSMNPNPTEDCGESSQRKLDPDGESMDSIDTNSLIASLDDLVKDLEGMADKKAETLSSVLEPEKASKIFKPLLVQSINNDLGIPKGDVMLSLLNEHTDRTWASRITEAVWRCRSMRQNCDTRWLLQKLQKRPGSPSHARTSLAVDVDDNEIVGGIEKVEEAQKSALEHLKYDDFDDALALYENIATTSFRYFEGLIRNSTNLPHAVLLERLAYFKAFVGACMHNIGIIHLLRGDYLEAHSCFEKATVKRAECHGVGTTDHLASYVKKAICQLALNDLVEAARSYEECLMLAQKCAKSISDQRQIAEILNNLACLAFLAGRPEKALELFKESWNVSQLALDHSLYAGARFSCHSSTLNMSVTRGNIGFLAILGKDIPAALEAFEYTVTQQQLLLRDAHRTLIASMDHLVVVQVILGNKEKAIRLLRRMYLMQVDAFGPDDKRCAITNDKIVIVQETGKLQMSEGDVNTSPGSFEENDDHDKEEDSSKAKTTGFMKMLKKMAKKR